MPSACHILRRSLRLVSITSVMALVSACSTTDYFGEWYEPRPTLLPYSKMLIVVDTPYQELRKDLEMQLYEGTTRGGTLAATSSDLGSNGSTEREALVLMLEESFADSLLLIRFTHPQSPVDSTKIIDITPPEAEMTERPASALAPLAEQIVNIDATVYDISSNGRAVYNVALETEFKDREEETLSYASEEIARSILDELRGVKIIDD